ncbi:acetyl-CoA carboxylase carboxyltransferase subunit alpha [Erysipelothrix sp. HDW6C]|uniref:acetyl-CoA carboxylase carboxyltransferase subunit alpha n=1 Tax=Erysipelothrix sp. HDW6C TaxID=2714930 RepID=UPI00140B42F3|nr:acetyl-CoA carboxylase carboxyltransferase subunit alpha [Erysipelothrix sp. HDW6C]QIK69711.1 acetyl-CoA carboxylase carboxyltransferase subunit alpha [Erysipelothrix sp. HDW6C]
MNTRIKHLEKEIKELKKQKFNTEHLEMSLSILKQEYHSQLSSWDKVQLARAKDRAGSKQFIEAIFTDFTELHGDRNYGDDGAILGGIAHLHDMPVTVIGVVKGQTTEENLKSNFGMVHPEGYRKALRLMKQAEKFNRPIITLIDTPGAYPGIGAEERGQGQAIAQNLVSMMDLKVPVIAIILGEAGSGGALALAVANQVWMMEHAIYSILSPEGFASILYKDASKAPEIVDDMKITSDHLFALGLIDEVIEEKDDFVPVAKYLKARLYRELSAMKKMKAKQIQKQRYERFRNIGEVIHEK